MLHRSPRTACLLKKQHSFLALTNIIKLLAVRYNLLLQCLIGGGNSTHSMLLGEKKLSKTFHICPSMQPLLVLSDAGQSLEDEVVPGGTSQSLKCLMRASFVVPQLHVLYHV